MLINSEIFNEARNVNSAVIRTVYHRYSENGDIAINARYRLNRIYRPIIMHEELRHVNSCDYRQALEAEGEDDPYTALCDIIDDASPISDFLDRNYSIWFIPEDSLLATALEDYFTHLTGIHNLKASGKKFIHDFRWSQDGNRYPGFYMVSTSRSKSGIHDEFFIGMLNKKSDDKTIGSGTLAKRFLTYINSDVKQPNRC